MKNYEIYKSVKGFIKENALKGLAGIVLGAAAIGVGGCSKGFFESDFIEQNTQKIFDKQQSIEEKYRSESGIEIVKQPKSSGEPTLVRNADKTCTLFYRCQFVETIKLEEIVKKQVTSCITSVAEPSNQLIVKFPDESQVDYVKELLKNSDRIPSQVLLKLNIYNDYGDHTRDFATHLELEKTNSSVFSTTTADYPGASTRVRGREDIGTKYGLGYEDKNFRIKAILDVLESLGYVQQIYQTTILLPNKEKGTLEEEEKLPIPNYVVAGQNVVQTFALEPIRSFFEATPTIYENGLIKLTFRAGIGSSKRPEGPIQVTVPVKDEVNVAGVYLKVGQPFIVAGKANQLELGVRRKDPVLPIFGGKDWEKRVSRIWYEITPYKVIYPENGESGGQNDNEQKAPEPDNAVPKNPAKFNILFE